jgi:hypothetical protein
MPNDAIQIIFQAIIALFIVFLFLFEIFPILFEIGNTSPVVMNSIRLAMILAIVLIIVWIIGEVGGGR